MRTGDDVGGGRKVARVGRGKVSGGKLQFLNVKRESWWQLWRPLKSWSRSRGRVVWKDRNWGHAAPWPACGGGQKKNKRPESPGVGGWPKTETKEADTSQHTKDSTAKGGRVRGKNERDPKTLEWDMNVRKARTNKGAGRKE